MQRGVAWVYLQRELRWLCPSAWKLEVPDRYVSEIWISVGGVDLLPGLCLFELTINNYIHSNYRIKRERVMMEKASL